MNRVLILLMITLGMFGCTDPTRVITNKPKSAEQKLQERDQRRREDKVATEALKSFRVTDHAGPKSRQPNPKETPVPNDPPSKSDKIPDGAEQHTPAPQESKSKSQEGSE